MRSKGAALTKARRESRVNAAAAAGVDIQKDESATTEVAMTETNIGAYNADAAEKAAPVPPIVTEPTSGYDQDAESPPSPGAVREKLDEAQRSSPALEAQVGSGP